MNPDAFRTRFSLLLVSSLTVMAGATIAPALPAMQAYFSDMENAGLWVRFVLTVPALLIVLSAPLAGMVVDRWGRKYLLVPSMVLYGLAGSSGLYLDSITGILIGRALLGIAVAGAMTSATTLIADYYAGTARAKFMGWQAAFMGFGGVVFLVGGGVLAELGWRWPFMIYLLSLIFIPLILISITESVNTGRSANPGIRSEHDVEGNPFKLLGFIFAAALFGMTIFYFVPLQIPFYLEVLFNTGPTASGVAIAISTLFGIITSLSYGRIRGMMGYIPVLGLNFGLMGAGYVIISLAGSYALVLTGLATCGLGMGFMFPNLNVWLASDIPVAIRGRAVGGLTTAVFLGQFLSPLISQPLVHSFGLQNMFLTAGFTLLSLALVFVLFRQQILTFIK